MREHHYRALLSRSIGEDSANSYVAYCARVERELGCDLDQLDLSEDGLANMPRRLGACGIPRKSVQNCMSALRAYSKLDRR